MFLEMAAATGARRGEVLALSWSDIQDAVPLLQGRLQRPSGDWSSREPRMSGHVWLAFRKEPRARLNPTESAKTSSAASSVLINGSDLDLIFSNPDVSPLKPDSISSAVSRFSRRLKVPKGASLHTLCPATLDHRSLDDCTMPASSILYFQ